MVSGTPEVFKKVVEASLPKKGRMKASLSQCSHVIEKVVNNTEHAGVVIINTASRIQDIKTISPADLTEFNYNMFHLCHNATPKIIMTKEEREYLEETRSSQKERGTNYSSRKHRK